MGSLVRFGQPRTDAAAIAAAIQRVYADTCMAQRARDLAQSLRPALVGDTPALVRTTVRRVLELTVAA